MARFRYAASSVALLVALSTPPGGQAQSVQTGYTYDVHGRLVTVTRPGLTTTYTYDNANNRVHLVTAGANTPPVAKSDGTPDSLISVTAGNSVSFNPLANDTDADSDNFYLTNVTGWNANNATSVTFTANCLRTAASCVTYNAKSGQGSGSDTFSYTIADGKGGTATGTITVTINASVAPPVTSASTTPVTANYAGSTTSYPLSLGLSGGTPTSLTITSPPPSSAGTAVVSGNSILFTPTNGYSGQTQLQYTASNAGGTSSAATATINVKPVVSAVQGNATTGSQTSLALYPRTNFTSLNLVGSGAGVYGNASISGSNVLYRPTSGAGQTETFAYTATTAGGTSTSASITFNIIQGNRAPIANDSDPAIDTYQGVTSTLYPLANDSDPDNDPITLQSVGPLEFVYGNNGTPSNLGSIAKNGNTVTFTAPPVCNCAARSKYHVVRFTYTIVDSKGATSTAKHAMNVYSNLPPVANVENDHPVNAGVTTVVDPRVNDTDGDGDALTIRSIDNFYAAYAVIDGVRYERAQIPLGSFGSVVNNGTSVSYTAPHLSAGSYMAVVFWYTVTDGRGGTSQSYEVLNVYGPG